jgi:ribonucleotide reductase alpha subunit
MMNLDGLIKFHLEAWKLGVKTLYYLRSDSVIKGDLGSRTAECVSCDG